MRLYEIIVVNKMKESYSSCRMLSLFSFEGYEICVVSGTGRLDFFIANEKYIEPMISFEKEDFESEEVIKNTWKAYAEGDVFPFLRFFSNVEHDWMINTK